MPEYVDQVAASRIVASKSAHLCKQPDVVADQRFVHLVLVQRGKHDGARSRLQRGVARARLNDMVKKSVDLGTSAGLPMQWPIRPCRTISERVRRGSETLGHSQRSGKHPTT